MPDATGLELIAQELRAAESDGVEGSPTVLETVFFRGRATLVIEPERVRLMSIAWWSSTFVMICVETTHGFIRSSSRSSGRQRTRSTRRCSWPAGNR